MRWVDVRSRGEHSPAHHPGMHPGKALAGGMGRGGWLIRAWIPGLLREVEIVCRNTVKGAMRHFWKIANRAIVACAGKLFCELPGKNFR